MCPSFDEAPRLDCIPKYLPKVKLRTAAHGEQPPLSDRPERDPADDSALLFGRTSCRSRRKNNYKILLLTGAQDLLFGQDLLPEQELPIEQ